MDKAVLNVKKGQDIVIIIEGYEDHTASFDYDDVLQVILHQAQNDLNKRRNDKWRKKSEAEMKEQAYANQAQIQCGSQAAAGLGLYPR